MTRSPLRGLYGIVDSGVTSDLVGLATWLLLGGAALLQLRMKGSSDADVEAALAAIVPLARAAGTPLLVNDRAHLAARFADVGVHLGRDDMPPAKARALLGPERLIGLSTHRVQDVLDARRLPVDYLGFGPVFSAAGKHRTAGDPRRPMSARGLGALRAAVDAALVPVFAIGGIDQVSLDAVLATGVAGVAVIGAVASAPDPAEAARRMAAACARARTP